MISANEVLAVVAITYEDGRVARAQIHPFAVPEVRQLFISGELPIPGVFEQSPPLPLTLERAKELVTDAVIEDFIERSKQALSGVPASWRRVALEDFPAGPVDHEFREAWIDRGGRIEVDLDKAKEIRREQLRIARAPLLTALDIEATKALSAKDDAKLAEVVAEKQRLFDITQLPAIDAARTPEELKAVGIEKEAAAEAAPLESRGR